MKKMLSTRVDEDLLTKMKKAVEVNRPQFASIAHFVEVAIYDLIKKTKNRPSKDRR